MKTKEMPDKAGTPKDQNLLKDNDYFFNNQFINELNRLIAEENPKVNRFSLFDVVTFIGLAVLVIHFLLKI